MAGNKAFDDGHQLRMAVASTVDSGDPLVIGGMSGVALTDYSANDGKATVDFHGVYDLSVKGVNDAGNVAVAAGDELYYVAGDTPHLSKKSSGVFYGYALEAVISAATTTINVKLASASRDSFLSGEMYATANNAEVTATGSAQSIAHGLGVIPSKVFIILTEFASNISVDVLEGTHTTSNVVVTVTSGAKFKVLAIA